MSENNNDSFSTRGKSYQKKVVQALFEDRLWAEQMFDILNEEYFDIAYLQVVVKMLKAYYAKYQTTPTMETFISLLEEAFSGDGEKLLKDQIVKFLIDVRTYPLANDSDIIKDTAHKFCVRKSLGNAILDIAQDVQGKEFNPDQIIGKMQKAAYVGASKDVGHSYVDEFSKRCELTKRNGIPTGFDVLDDKNILNGGLEPGEMGTIIAAAGAGKSMMMVNIAANALSHGYNVIYYTLELAEHKIGLRFDANFSEIGQSEVVFHKESVKEIVEKKCKGKLYIKSYPPRVATTNVFKSHIRQLNNQKGFKPDLIIIDYADIMGEVMTNVRRGGESAYESQGSVYEQIRAFSAEVGCPVWTASQATRAAASEKILNAEHIAESFRKMHTADVAIGLSRTPEDKVEGNGRITLIKNRLGQDGMVFPITLDTSTTKANVFQPMSGEMVESLLESKNRRRGGGAEMDTALFKKLREKLDDRDKK